MRPVVNGQVAQYGEQVDFRELNAAFGEGKDAFDAYALPGHPSYVVLNPAGEVLWRGFGPQSGATIAEVIEDVLLVVAE
jgi:hypothetical protein